MSTLLEQEVLATNSDLRARVKIAALKIANTIRSNPERENEWNYCSFILKEPNNHYWLDQLVFSAIVISEINLQSTDQNVEDAVESIFSNFSVNFNI